MRDKIFERSLITLSVCVLLWIVLGIIFRVMGFRGLGIAPVIIIGLVVEIVGGGALLHFWGKDYMSRG